MKVMTIKGPLDLESLHVRDVVTLSENTRKVATEYYLTPECRPGIWPEGDLVKRSVTADMLMPMAIEMTAGVLA